MTRAPSFETCQRIIFLFSAADLDERVLRHASFRGLDARRLVGLLLVVRWPGRIAKAFLLVTSGELEQREQRRGMLIDIGMTITDRREPGRHRCQGEVARLARVDLIPGERSRHPRIGLRPHRIRSRHSTILCILIVVKEDAVPFFLPPFAGCQIRRAPLDLARKCQRRASYFREGPSAFDADVDVNPARA